MLEHRPPLHIGEENVVLDTHPRPITAGLTIGGIVGGAM
jgi:hypothetical protein